MKSNLCQGLSKDLQNQKTKSGPDSTQTHADAFDSLNRFNNELAFKLEIFDPLDRQFEDKAGEGDDQPIKRDHLIEVLKEMPGLKGSSLCAPLSNNQFHTFKCLMDQEFKECSAVTELYIKGAMENGNWFMEDIMKH